MKDWKKAALWVLVGFCLVSVIGSIFSLGAFLQMESTEIENFLVRDELKDFFIDITTWTLVGAIVCVALIVVATIYSAKSKNLKLLILVLVTLIVTFVISIFFIVFSYCILPYLKLYNETFRAFYGSTSPYPSKIYYMYYRAFYHYESYLSTAVSVFLPLLIASGLIFGYLIYKAKQQQREKISEQTNTEN